MLTSCFIKMDENPGSGRSRYCGRGEEGAFSQTKKRGEVKCIDLQ